MTRLKPYKAVRNSAAKWHTTLKSNNRTKRSLIRPEEESKEKGEPEERQDALPWTNATTVAAQLPREADGIARKQTSTVATSEQLDISKAPGRSLAGNGSTRMVDNGQERAAALVRSNVNILKARLILTLSNLDTTGQG